MKNPAKKIIPFTLAVMIVFLTNCSLIEQDIDGNLSATLRIFESKTGGPLPYSDVMVIDANSDQDIKDNLDKLKDWRVTKLTYSVEDYAGDPSITFSGRIGFSHIDKFTESIITSVSNVNFSSISDDGKEYDINLSEEQLNQIAGYFESGQGIRVYLSGELSQGPVEFDLIIYAKVKVKTKL